MKAKPLIAGALVLAPITGGLAGQMISTDPITDATDISATLPQHSPVAVADATPRTTPRLPDHYAMETPEGTVEVHELAMRGRYRDRYEPYQRWQAETERNLAMLEAEWGNAAPQTQQAAPEPAAKPKQAPQQVATVDVGLGVPEPQASTFRVINVESELALQR